MQEFQSFGLFWDCKYVSRVSFPVNLANTSVIISYLFLFITIKYESWMSNVNDLDKIIKLHCFSVASGTHGHMDMIVYLHAYHTADVWNIEQYCISMRKPMHTSNAVLGLFKIFRERKECIIKIFRRLIFVLAQRSIKVTGIRQPARSKKSAVSPQVRCNDNIVKVSVRPILEATLKWDA